MITVLTQLILWWDILAIRLARLLPEGYKDQILQAILLDIDEDGRIYRVQKKG